jgi:hypothetical protein
MSLGGSLRAAAVDFYHQSWRLVVFNTVLSVVALAVVYLTVFVSAGFAVLVLLLGPLAGALMHCTVQLAQEDELRFRDGLTGLGLHWRRGVSLAAILLLVTVAGVIALRFYGSEQWLLTIFVADVLAVFAVLQVFVWPRAIFQRDSSLRRVHADALSDFLARPLTAFGFALALVVVNALGIAAGVMPFLTLTIAYSFLAAAHFALPRSQVRS